MDSTFGWLIFLLILVLIFVIVWALMRNRVSNSDLPMHVEEHPVADTTEYIPEVFEELVIPEPSSVAHAGQTIEAKVEDSSFTGDAVVVTKLSGESSKPANVDDLVVIEGIGPKIAKVLAEAGITTFQKLAETDVVELKKLLTANNLRLNDPTSWPEQARLLAAGDLDGLKSLQSRLKGGRSI